MKAFIIGLLLGVALCVGGVWFINNRNLRVDTRQVGKELGTAATNAKNYVEEKVDSLHLDPAKIKEELSNVGAIIRRKAMDASHAISDATADTAITAKIKGKLLEDKDLSVLSISVNTTDGVVTLSGATSSPENIRKAIQLAWDTDGVRQVVSTIQVKE